MENLPKELMVFIVCLMTAMVTEVASNTATASILMPVLKNMVSTMVTEAASNTATASILMPVLKNMVKGVYLL